MAPVFATRIKSRKPGNSSVFHISDTLTLAHSLLSWSRTTTTATTIRNNLNFPLYLPGETFDLSSPTKPVALRTSNSPGDPLSCTFYILFAACLAVQAQACLRYGFKAGLLFRSPTGITQSISASFIFFYGMLNFIKRLSQPFFQGQSFL